MTYKEIDIADSEDLSITDIELDMEVDESELPELEEVHNDEMATQDRAPVFFALPFKIKKGPKKGQIVHEQDIGFKEKRIGTSSSFRLRRVSIKNISSAGVDITRAFKIGKNKYAKAKKLRPGTTVRFNYKRTVVVRFALVNKSSNAKFSIDVK